MTNFMGDFWWVDHLADLITLVMSGCLFLLGVILVKWPPPRTWARWGALITAFIASGVTFWNTAIANISPHPRISVSFFLFFLTAAMLKYRATAVAKSQTMHRRIDD